MEINRIYEEQENERRTRQMWRGDRSGGNTKEEGNWSLKARANIRKRGGPRAAIVRAALRRHEPPIVMQIRPLTYTPR